MRLTESLIIPDELEVARANGELVIFAGAGVSVPSPSNLPNFLDLAKNIAEPRVICSKSDARALDRYLGRAARIGVDVQARARELLSVGGSHTQLHEHLVALFADPERVRLVTTNFDQHFSTALRVVYPHGNVPEYTGPALPPGQHFHGIAQLHGSLDQKDFNLVLTDRDFGEAYMAEGWASRFLTKLFADRAVLFVGYSLSDPIMQYLLHAIPAGRRWYSLQRHSEADRGADHPISTIAFGRPRSRKPFVDLNLGIQRWRWYATRTPTDHDAEIRGLVRNGPPKSPLDVDYLQSRLATREGRAVFCSEARSVEWFSWIASHEYLNDLFEPLSSADAVASWAEWCLEHFCEGEAPPLLRLVRRRSLGVHPSFANAIVSHLWRKLEGKPKSTVMQLVALLVNQGAKIAPDQDIWAYLIGHLLKHQHAEAAFAILRMATELNLESAHPFEQFEDRETSSDSTPIALTSKVRCRFSPDRLSYVLGEHQDTLVNVCASRILALAEERISEAYDLLALASGGTPSFDALNYGRTSISPIAQDRFSHVEDLLVDLARIAIDHLTSMGAAEVKAFICRNEVNARGLLRRLAVYAHAVSPVQNADNIIARAGDLRWAQDWMLRPELYAVLKAHFCASSVPCQRRFVNLIDDDAWWGENADHELHLRFSLAHLLERACPASQDASDFAKRQRLAHPEWQEADCDGLWMRVGVSWGDDGPTPMSAEELGALSPIAAYNAVQSALGEERSLGGSLSLLGQLQHLVRKQPTWGIELLASALDSTAAHQITESVLFGLREAEASHANLLSLLVLIRSDWEPKLARAFGSVVLEWCKDLGEGASTDLLDALDSAADIIYDRSRTTEPAIADGGWTERAINHAAGYAAKIWWRVANARDLRGGAFVASLDDGERLRWLKVLEDESSAGAFARPILGMVTDRLAAADHPWTIEKIVPAFFPKRGAETASQLWDGRLMQHQWYWGTFEALRPALREMLRRSADLLPARARQLGEFIAFIVAQQAHSGFSKNELHSFVQFATEDAREAFADALPRQLTTLEPLERVRLWQELLLPYWRDRCTNMPMQLSSVELREMLSWLPSLSEVADEVVKQLRASPKVWLQTADGLFFRWKDEMEWPTAHPEAAAGAILFLLERESLPPWCTDDAVTILVAAKKAGASKTTLIAVIQLLSQQFPAVAVTVKQQILNDE